MNAFWPANPSNCWMPWPPRACCCSAVLLEQRERALAPHALHMKEYLALNLLADSVHEPLRPSSLSVSLDATRTQVTRLLDGLEQRGLVVRSADAQDRRSLQLRLTPSSALLAPLLPLVQAVYAQIWSSIGDAELRMPCSNCALCMTGCRPWMKSTPAAD